MAKALLERDAALARIDERLREASAGRGDGDGIFDLDSRGAVTLSVTRVTTAGPPAAQVTDALVGRAQTGAVLGELPGSSHAALSYLADFFNTPVGQGPG